VQKLTGDVKRRERRSNGGIENKKTEGNGCEEQVNAEARYGLTNYWARRGGTGDGTKGRTEEQVNETGNGQAE
jgi:hypothetical protein